MGESQKIDMEQMSLCSGRCKKVSLNMVDVEKYRSVRTPTNFQLHLHLVQSMATITMTRQI